MACIAPGQDQLRAESMTNLGNDCHQLHSSRTDKGVSSSSASTRRVVMRRAFPHAATAALSAVVDCAPNDRRRQTSRTRPTKFADSLGAALVMAMLAGPAQFG